MFYNAAMALDRDLGVAVARGIAARRGGRRGSAWEMLAATGVRGLRTLSEGGAWEDLLLTEANGEAFAVLERNVARYSPLGARGTHRDARAEPVPGPFDYIDLDPYGSPVPFAGALFAAARPEAIVAVTATDTRVLAGVDRGACERRYGARPLRGRLAPEAGLRILLAWLAGQAESRGRSVRPLLAYVHDHYVRAYLALDSGPPERPVALVHDGDVGPPLPGRGPYGPMWTGPLFDADFVRGLRVPEGASDPVSLGRLLDRLADESRADRPFFFEANEIARRLGLASPPPVGDLIDALEAGGWSSARTHARPGAFRSTAPWTAVAETARAVASQKAGAGGPAGGARPLRGEDPNTRR